MYRNNDHYNSLNLKGSVIMTKHSKKKPKASKHIFESKIKEIDKKVNLIGEKKLTLIQKILYFLSSNIDSQSLILMNLLIITFILKEFINNHIIKERTKKSIRSKVNYGKKYKINTIVVDKNMQRDVLMKNWNFPSIKNKYKKINIK